MFNQRSTYYAELSAHCKYNATTKAFQ